MLDNQEPCIKKCNAAWYSRCQIIWYSCCTWNQMNRDSRWWEADPEQGLWFHRSPEMVCRKGRQVTKIALIPLEKTLDHQCLCLKCFCATLENSCRIILVFDAHKLDISDEFKHAIEAIRAQDDKIRIILNKVFINACLYFQTRKGTSHLNRQTWWPTNSWWGSTGPCSGPCQRS